MDYLTLVLGVGALVLPVLTYFAGVERGRRYRQEDQRQRAALERRQRIDRVVEAYLALALAHPPLDTGERALVKAGVHDLRDDAEIDEALSKIADRTGRHPLGRRAPDIERAGLKAYFDNLRKSAP